MNGPTMRDCADGSARRTAKSPRSTVRGTITRAMASHAKASPAAGSLPRKKLMFAPSVPAPADPVSNGLERLLFYRIDQAVELGVDLVPIGKFFHVAKPARHVGVFREIDPDHLTEGHEARAEIVRNGNLAPAQIGLVRPDPMVIQDLQPSLGVLAAPFDRRGMRLIAPALVMREELRIAQAIPPIPIEVAVEPIHDLVDLGALLQVLRIGR